MPIPDKGFFDTPAAPDSLLRIKARKDMIQAEAERLAQLHREAEERRLARERRHVQEARDDEEDFVNNLPPGDSRDHLLERIRSMRAEVAPERKPPPLSERMQEKLRLEQECGRAIVARRQADADALREARLRREAEELAKYAAMVPLITPNPTMDERFPVNKSTIDGPGGVLKK